MRYHWGLGVGHIHAHGLARSTWSPLRVPPTPDYGLEEASGSNDIGVSHLGNDSDVENSDDPELDLEDRHLEGWEDVESDGGEDEEGEQTEEETFMGM